MSMHQNQSSLTIASAVDDTLQTNRAWLATALARYTMKHRADLGMTVARAAELSGLELSEWMAIEAGWVPEDSRVRRAIAATLQVGYTGYSFLATVSASYQSTC